MFIAHTGPAGLRLAEQEGPDVVLCDIGLPGMVGYEVARSLRRLPRFARTRLIALTGYAQPSDVDRSRAAGFDDHLAKPVEPARLLHSLRPDAPVGE